MTLWNDVMKCYQCISQEVKRDVCVRVCMCVRVISIKRKRKFHIVSTLILHIFDIANL